MTTTEVLAFIRRCVKAPPGAFISQSDQDFLKISRRDNELVQDALVRSIAASKARKEAALEAAAVLAAKALEPPDDC